MVFNSLHFEAKISVKQLSEQFLLLDLQFLDLYMSIYSLLEVYMFIFRIHAFKHFISYFHSGFSESH